MSPVFREDQNDHIVRLAKRIERLERGHDDAGVGFVDLNGNILFSVDGNTSTVGFFGRESIQQATPVTLADVILLLQQYGLAL